MRKRLHIERRVEKLANSKTLEVIEGVLEKLANPQSHQKWVEKDKVIAAHKEIARQFEQSWYGTKEYQSTWNCSCLYCRLHLAYTYAQIRLHIANKQGRFSIADEYWSDISKLKRLKEKLEELPLDSMAKTHIHDAKIFIGKEISALRHDAMLEYNNMRDLEFSTERFIEQNQIKPIPNYKTISWF